MRAWNPKVARLELGPGLVEDRCGWHDDALEEIEGSRAGQQRASVGYDPNPRERRHPSDSLDLGRSPRPHLLQYTVSSQCLMVKYQ